MASGSAFAEAGYVLVIIVAFVLVLMFLLQFAPVEPYQEYIFLPTNQKPMNIYSGMQMS
jgi:hypothetical protein